MSTQFFEGIQYLILHPFPLQSILPYPVWTPKMLSRYKEVHGLCRTINPLLQVGELFRCHLWSIVHLSSSNCRRGALFFYITQWLNLKTIQTVLSAFCSCCLDIFFAFVFPNFSILCLTVDEFDIIVHSNS